MTSSIVQTMSSTKADTTLPGLLSAVGDTPLIQLQRSLPRRSRGIRILIKAEWFNPGGSVKDRAARLILQTALRNGYLEGEKVLLDSTSGNMGMAYATFGTILGIPVHLAIPSNAGSDRLSNLRALGAKLTLTDPLEGSDGAREVAAQMAKENPERFYYADQYSNPANWIAHYETTGPEIVAQTEGMVTHFIAGLGTTGTMMGCGRFLKERVPGVQLVAVQPNSPLHGLEGLKHLATSPVPEIFDSSLPDVTIEVATEDAYRTIRQLAREEGMLVGISAGAAIHAALELASQLQEGLIVVLLPDSGHRYLSQPFWSET